MGVIWAEYLYNVVDGPRFKAFIGEGGVTALARLHDRQGQNVNFAVQPRAGITSGTACDATSSPEPDHYCDPYIGQKLQCLPTYLCTTPFLDMGNI